MLLDVIPGKNQGSSSAQVPERLILLFPEAEAVTMTLASCQRNRLRCGIAADGLIVRP